MNIAVKQFEQAQTPAQILAPVYSVEVTHSTAQITVELPDHTLVYSVDFDTEVDSTRIYSDEAECLVMTATADDNCTVTAYDEENDVIYETMIKTPDWIHTDAVVEIEEEMTACEY